MSVVRSIHQTYLFRGLLYETEFHTELRVIRRPREQTRARALGEGSIGRFGFADASCCNRIDKEQSPVAWRWLLRHVSLRQLYAISRDKPQWEKYKKECVCMHNRISLLYGRNPQNICTSTGLQFKKKFFKKS